MKLREFEEALEKDDFAVGDTFWIDGWEFEVVNSRMPGKDVCNDQVVFRWVFPVSRSGTGRSLW